MKNYAIAVIVIIALVFTACNRTSGTQQQTANDLHPEILAGDLSAYAGTWVNGDGERVQLKADGMWGDDGIRVFGFEKTGDGANAKYSWNVLIIENDERFGDIYTVLDLFPVGVENDIRGEYLVNNSFTRGIFPTDNTKDRIVRTASIMPDSPFISSSVYYREGEYPSVQPQTIDPYASILNGDLSAFEGAWVTARGARMYLNPDGTSGGYERAAGHRLNDHGYYQWSVSFEGAGGYGVELYPAGVEVREIPGHTDITKDRLFLITSGDAVYNPDAFYYREGELPMQNDSTVFDLSGQWRFESGSSIVFFRQAFVDFHPDGIVEIWELRDGLSYLEGGRSVIETGGWDVTGIGELSVHHRSAPQGAYHFSFTARDDVMRITDNNGNTAVYQKIYLQ